jgi:thioredoxin-like negative regulator of GroEL
MVEDKVAKWQKACEQRPQDELARFTLAKALFEAGRCEEAAPEFQRAIDVKPDWLMAHVFLAKCMVEAGRCGDAVIVLKHARELALAQDHKDPLFEIDDLLEELGP